MISKKQYGDYLLSTPFNYTCPTLADPLDGVRHEFVNDSRSVRPERLRPRQWWDLVQGRIEDGSDVFLIVADSVHASRKRYSRFIELVKWQYRGTEHRPSKGIGVVNLVA